MARRPARIHLKEDLSTKSFPCAMDLSVQDAHHLSDVLRLTASAPLEVFDANGNCYHAELMDQDRMIILERSSQNAPPSILQVRVYQSPPRAGHFDPFVKPLAELGATELIPLLTERTIVQKDERGWKTLLGRWERLAHESAKQSGRAVPMKIRPATTFQQALAERREVDFGFLLSPQGHSVSFADWNRMIEGVVSHSHMVKMGILIGPEGGFSEREQAQALESRWQLFCINPFVLRSETAAMAAMAIFQFVVSSLSNASLKKEESR